MTALLAFTAIFFYPGLRFTYHFRPGDGAKKQTAQGLFHYRGLHVLPKIASPIVKCRQKHASFCSDLVVSLNLSRDDWCSERCQN